MKKYLIICFILSFSSYVYAENTMDIILKTCSEASGGGDFYYGSNCSWLEKNIYYIKDKKVTKEKYDSERKISNEKWPICDETRNSISEEFLQSFLVDSTAYQLSQNFSIKCIKWSYWEYRYKGDIISYEVWHNLVVSDAIKQVTEKSIIEVQNRLKNQEEQLKTFESFIKSIKDWTWSWVNPYEVVVWGECFSMTNITYNWNWYKNIVCKNNKIESLDYIIDNKIVSYDSYMNRMYEDEKKYLYKEVEYYKTHDYMWNKKLDIWDNEPKEQKTETNLNNNKKTKAKYIKQLVTSKNKLKENFDEKVIIWLDKKLNTIKDKIKKEEPQKQKVILENLYIGFEKISTKYKENKWKDLLEYTKSYFELNFFNL